MSPQGFGSCCAASNGVAWLAIARPSQSNSETTASHRAPGVSRASNPTGPPRTTTAGVRPEDHGLDPSPWSRWILGLCPQGGLQVKLWGTPELTNSRCHVWRRRFLKQGSGCVVKRCHSASRLCAPQALNETLDGAPFFDHCVAHMVGRHGAREQHRSTIRNNWRGGGRAAHAQRYYPEGSVRPPTERRSK